MMSGDHRQSGVMDAWQGGRCRRRYGVEKLLCVCGECVAIVESIPVSGCVASSALAHAVVRAPAIRDLELGSPLASRG